jgi:N-acetyl-gamma-glutamyl-phosphate reductase
MLSRHPHVSLVAATSSGATAARKLPALKHIWNGTIVPLDADQLARDADLVFLALPDTAAAELAPKFADAGVRVIDLSGALRLHDDALRASGIGHHSLPDGLVYGLTEHARDAVRTTRRCQPGCYPTAALLALRPLVRPVLPQAPTSCRCSCPAVGAGKTPIERTHFSEVYASLAPTASAPARRGNRTGVRRAGHVHALLPIDRGILETIYVRRTCTTRGVGDIYDAAYRTGLRARGRFRAARNQARDAHELLRHGWRVDATGRVVIARSSTTCLGRVPAGHPEHERHAVPKRRACCDGTLVIKFGGELLGRVNSQAVVGAIATVRRRVCRWRRTAAAGDRCRPEGGAREEEFYGRITDGRRRRRGGVLAGAVNKCLPPS